MGRVRCKPFLRSLCCLVLAVMSVHMIVACDRASPSEVQAQATGPLRVVVTIPPLLWAAKAIAPADAQITLILAPGQSEHGFEITPSQFKAINDADIVAMVGYSLEPKVEATLKLGDRARRRVVNFEGIDGVNPIVADHEHENCTDPSHDHSHGYDPHVWLDPPIMKAFVERFGRAVLETLDASGSRFSEAERGAEQKRVERAVAELIADCNAVDAEYRQKLSEASSRVIVTHHNAYSYVARRYALEVAAVIRPVEVVEPTPGDIKAVTDAIRERGVKAIFVEPQFSSVAAERIAQSTGIKVLPLDPLGDGDWPATMRKNLDSLVTGLSAQ